MSANNSTRYEFDRLELARQGDKEARKISNILIEGARQERQRRVHDAGVDPIGAYLTIVDWLMRWHLACLRRYFRGRDIPLFWEEEEHDWNLSGAAGDRYLDQLGRLDEFRGAVLVWGCRLGASPVEMSRLLSEIVEVVSGSPSWAEFLSQGEHAAWDEFEKKDWDIKRAMQPLHDLRLWEAINKPADSSTAARHLTLSEANLRARELAEQNPALFKNITARELAKLIGCSVGLVGKLPIWKALIAETGRGRKNTAACPKAITFTENIENSIGEPNAELQRLIEEQSADDRQQQIRSRQRI